jgi:hypothetical protein
MKEDTATTKETNKQKETQNECEHKKTATTRGKHERPWFKQGNVPPSTSMDPTPASLSSFLFLHSYSDICQCFVQGSTQETNKQVKPINKQEAH